MLPRFFCGGTSCSSPRCGVATLPRCARPTQSGGLAALPGVGETGRAMGGPQFRNVDVRRGAAQPQHLAQAMDAYDSSHASHESHEGSIGVYCTRLGVCAPGGWLMQGGRGGKGGGQRPRRAIQSGWRRGHNPVAHGSIAHGLASTGLQCTVPLPAAPHEQPPTRETRD